MQLAKDLLHPSPEEEKRRHKKKRLVQSPNSYFMDVKCPGTLLFLICIYVSMLVLFSFFMFFHHLYLCGYVGSFVSGIVNVFISFFPGCYKITTVFSHAQTVVLCVGCSTVLCQPTGGKARLTEGQY